MLAVAFVPSVNVTTNVIEYVSPGVIGPQGIPW